MSRESLIVYKLNEFGFSQENIQSLLLLDLKKPGSQQMTWGESYKIKSKNIIWWNDIEKDSRYQQYPRNIYNLLMPTYSGDFKYIRRNLYSTVFFLDITQEFDKDLLTRVFSFIQNGIPMRFGFVPMVDLDPQSTRSMIATSLLHMVGQKGGLKQCKEWIQKVILLF